MGYELGFKACEKPMTKKDMAKKTVNDFIDGEDGCIRYEGEDFKAMQKLMRDAIVSLGMDESVKAYVRDGVVYVEKTC